MWRLTLRCLRPKFFQEGEGCRTAVTMMNRETDAHSHGVASVRKIVIAGKRRDRKGHSDGEDYTPESNKNEERLWVWM
jgi:hypothetical protein